uniref:Rgg/GadR/MutR family transcriptional regulator n=1 Tax=Lactococcus petauri TaxID=1940789 RepID=UPI002549E968
MITSNKYGNTFKNLRKQLELKLTHFESLGISPGALSNFENGKSMVRFERLIMMLEYMSVTPNEYLDFTNNYTHKNHDCFLELILIPTFFDKRKTLESLQTRDIRQNEYILHLAMKSTYTSLNRDEVAYLSDYFEKIIYWRSIDLFSFFLCLNLKSLKPRQIDHILKNMYSENKYHFSIPSQKIIFSHILVHIVIYLVALDNKKESQRILSYIDPKNFEHIMETRNLYEIANNLYIYKFIDSNLGSDKVRNHLSIFEKLDNSILSEYYIDLI